MKYSSGTVVVWPIALLCTAIITPTLATTIVKEKCVKTGTSDIIIGKALPKGAVTTKWPANAWQNDDSLTDPEFFAPLCEQPNNGKAENPDWGTCVRQNSHWTGGHGLEEIRIKSAVNEAETCAMFCNWRNEEYGWDQRHGSNPGYCDYWVLSNANNNAGKHSFESGQGNTSCGKPTTNTVLIVKQTGQGDAQNHSTQPNRSARKGGPILEPAGRRRIIGHTTLDSRRDSRQRHMQ